MYNQLVYSCLPLVFSSNSPRPWIQESSQYFIMFSCSCIVLQGLNSPLTYDQIQALTLRDLSMVMKQKSKALTLSRKNTLVPISVLDLSSCVEANLLIFWLSTAGFCSSGQWLGLYYSPSPAKYLSPNTNYLLPVKMNIHGWKNKYYVQSMILYGEMNEIDRLNVTFKIHLRLRCQQIPSSSKVPVEEAFIKSYDKNQNQNTMNMMNDHSQV